MNKVWLWLLAALLIGIAGIIGYFYYFLNNKIPAEGESSIITPETGSPPEEELSAAAPKTENLSSFVFPAGGENLEIGKTYEIKWTPFSFNEDEWIRIEIKNTNESGIVNILERAVYVPERSDIVSLDAQKGTAKWLVKGDLKNFLTLKEENNKYQLILSKVGKGEKLTEWDPTAGSDYAEDVKMKIISNPFSIAYVNSSAYADPSDILVPINSPDAPGRVQGVKATISGNSVTLEWPAVLVGPGKPEAGYTIYRSNSKNFSPNSKNHIVQGNVLSYTDKDLGVGTYYYKVAAQNVNGLTGPASDEIEAIITP